MSEAAAQADALPNHAAVLGARLDRLPLSRFHYKLLVAGGLGYTFDAMDGAIVAFILPAVSDQWHLSVGTVGILGSSLLVGYLFGALGAGVLGDRIGRRAVMVSALLVYCAASVAAALAPNVGVLFAARVVAGIGTGAESSIVAPYLAEFVPSRVRGRYIGSLAGFFSFGYVLAGLLGYSIVAADPAGWRWAQVLSAVPIVMLLWWRRSLPESPRFLHAHGRVEEAEAVVADIEQSVAGRTGKPLPLPTPVPAAAPEQTAPVRDSVAKNLAVLFRTPLRRTTLATCAYWFAAIFTYYGFSTWLPSLLVHRGFGISQSFQFVILVYLAQVPGYYTAAFVGERLERKWAIVLYLAGGAGAACGLALSGSSAEILVWAMLLSFFMNGNAALEYVYTSELYPTRIRTTGLGVASAVGRLGGITAPILIGYSYTVVGFSGVFSILLAVLISGAAVVAAFGRRTTGRTLEAINSPGLSNQP